MRSISDPQNSARATPQDRARPFEGYGEIPGLVMEDVAVARGGLTILSGLSEVVAPGEALILRGPNGSGKTTLLRTLAGLQPPVRGTFAPGPEAMAYASHADGIKATLSVLENLRFWARVHGHDDLAPALAPFDLEGLRDRPAGALSAGQKRRLGLARLVLTRRPIWLLDEPTVSLDTASVERFAGTVRAHLAGGGIAVIATHIDLGLPEARVLDVAASRAVAHAQPDHADGGFGADDDGSGFL